MGLSFWHLIILLAIVLLFFGPQRLPTLGKSIGEAIRGFKKGLDEGEIDVTDRKEQISANDQKNKATADQKKKEEV